MQPKAGKDDRSHLQDIRESAQQAVKYVHGQTYDQFAADDRTRDAVAMRLTIIGEAAGKLSARTIAANPGVPVNQMRGLRNRIAHGYHEVDFKEVWKITQNELKPLIAEVEKVLKTLNEQQRQAEKNQQEAAAEKQKQAERERMNPSIAIRPPGPSNGPRMGI
jgi:uncharacterized protein with HEPN domain